MEWAQEWLGLTHGQADELFCAGNSRQSLCDLSDEQAVHVLRHFAETGVIDWDYDRVVMEADIE